jgi:hypothetical protein
LVMSSTCAEMLERTALSEPGIVTACQTGAVGSLANRCKGDRVPGSGR